mmetsp:Transcript_5060/g.10671  ORF Transcript_5060/g.10671 Transcript_5060/m.10671 type:complete len:266 (+) Transcript_5060:394-1191(+)
MTGTIMAFANRSRPPRTLWCSVSVPRKAVSMGVRMGTTGTPTAARAVMESTCFHLWITSMSGSIIWKTNGCSTVRNAWTLDAPIIPTVQITITMLLTTTSITKGGITVIIITTTIKAVRLLITNTATQIRILTMANITTIITTADSQIIQMMMLTPAKRLAHIIIRPVGPNFITTKILAPQPTSSVALYMVTIAKGRRLCCTSGRTAHRVRVDITPTIMTLPLVCSVTSTAPSSWEIKSILLHSLICRSKMTCLSVTTVNPANHV